MPASSQKVHIPMKSRRLVGEQSATCSLVQNSGLMLRIRATHPHCRVPARPPCRPHAPVSRSRLSAQPPPAPGPPQRPGTASVHPPYPRHTASPQASTTAPGRAGRPCWSRSPQAAGRLYRGSSSRAPSSVAKKPLLPVLLQLLVHGPLRAFSGLQRGRAPRPKIFPLGVPHLGYEVAEVFAGHVRRPG